MGPKRVPLGLSEEYEKIPKYALKETRLVDRDTVQFLIKCEANGMRIENCSTYTREWIGTELGK